MSLEHGNVSWRAGMIENAPCPGCGHWPSDANHDRGVCWVCATREAEVQDRENGFTGGYGGYASTEPPARRVVLTKASEIRPEPLRWLWTDRLPLHGLSLIAGEAGLGKSTTTVELTARITRGDLEGDLRERPRDVLICSAEDRWESVVVGRLLAARADLDRVHQVQVADPSGDTMLTLPDDVAAIEQRCDELATAGSPVGLLVIDPVSAYLASGTDSHKDAAVRRVLAPVAAMADRLGIAAVAIAHLNKSTAGKLLDRVGGSVAFGAAPRSVLAFARDPNDPNGEQGVRRVIVQVKSNHGRYAPTIAGYIEAADVPVVGSVSRLVIDGESEIGPEDLMVTRTAEDRSHAEEAAEWLVDELADGKWHPSREVKSAAKADRISEKALRTARERVGVEDRSNGFPRRTEWRLASRALAHGGGGHDCEGHDRKKPGTPDDLAMPLVQSCPSLAGGTTETDEALIEAIKKTFDAVELDGDEWRHYRRDHDIQDWPA